MQANATDVLRTQAPRSALLMEAAENGGSTEAATAQLELALFLEARYVRR